MNNIENKQIAVIGLGYVGLPLAVEFGKFFQTVGFDISKHRINDLIKGKDKTLEVDSSELKEAIHLSYSADVNEISSCNIFIITVPTPIDINKKPDLRPLISASETVGRVIKKNDIIVYESTVFPGATEEICVPILEEVSNLKFNIDFYCGYSPERINPGDKEHRLTSIKKVTSGSTPEIAEIVDSIYKKIIKVGTHKASSIKVAEASKVIENTQRDINIALINELAQIFNKLDIDTESVLQAAGTKWNFLPFRPGLVGGHCIGVDPYYLTHKAIEVGYSPDIILAGRRLNDKMGSYVVDKVISLMKKKKIKTLDAKILIMGMTFKENCPDLRNTRVIDVVNGFIEKNCLVDVYDPWVDKQESINEYGMSPIVKPLKSTYDAIILAVAHKEFADLKIEEIRSFGNSKHVLYDIKYLFDADQVDGRL
jgi:UDP-N-acetyl-D-glucosamine/UDP-N-acetyl-D-galactosamine dehydrogenase